MSVIYVDTSRSGYVRDEQYREWMDATATPFLLADGDNEPAEEIRPHAWMKTDMQGGVSACQGFALSKAGEFLYYCATGAVIQFSQMFCYVGSQKLRGIRGDQGSVCSDGVKLAEQTGFAEYELWPFGGRYVTEPPNGSYSDVAQKAVAYKSVGHQEITSFSQGIEHLRRRRGPIHLGFAWTGMIDEQASRGQGKIDTYSARGGGGGHSVEWLGVYLSHPGTGENWTQPRAGILNSWDVRWGWQGWSFWTEEAINAMLAHQWTEAIAMHGMTLGSGARKPNLQDLI